MTFHPNTNEKDRLYQNPRPIQLLLDFNYRNSDLAMSGIKGEIMKRNSI